MIIVFVPKGLHPVEYWEEWAEDTRKLLEADTFWAQHQQQWETMGGAAAQPINYPHYEDEIVVFPRNCNMRRYVDLLEDPVKRNKEYKMRLIQLSGNAYREGRGRNTFLLLPATFELIRRYIMARPQKSSTEVLRVLDEQYYKGKRPSEVESKVSTKTLSRYLQEAELALDILGEDRRRLKLSLKTLDISYTALRYGRDAGLDIRRYFYRRIF